VPRPRWARGPRVVGLYLQACVFMQISATFTFLSASSFLPCVQLQGLCPVSLILFSWEDSLTFIPISVSSSDFQPIFPAYLFMFLNLVSTLSCWQGGPALLVAWGTALWGRGKQSHTLGDLARDQGVR